MTQMAVGIGSNLGVREDHLRTAVVEMAACGRVVAVSPLYETAPIGDVDQDPFLNAVALLIVDRDPVDILATLQAIERAHGRKRNRRWGPRSLDLDVLLFGDRSVSEPGLTIPHPRMTDRRFVLQPLLDVWPEAALPDGTEVATFLPEVADQRVSIFADRWCEVL